MSRYILTTAQPKPIEGKKKVKEEMRHKMGGILDLDIIEDCIFKMEASEEKYGSPLMTHNGRDALVDCYQDLLDSINYLVQAYLEEDDIDERIYLQQGVQRLNRIAGFIRYRLEKTGQLTREQR